MNLLDKVGEGLAASVDVLVEKNRQLAQLNRLAAIIKTETDMIDRAYIALGKQYFKILEGNAEENDVSRICEVIKFSEERLKKAQARYDYVKVYGVPTSSVDTVDMIHTNDSETTDEPVEIPENNTDNDTVPEEENTDITIAVAEETTETAEVISTEDSTVEKNETDVPAEDDTAKTVAEKAAETVTYIKKKRSRKTETDNEAENDG